MDSSAHKYIPALIATALLVNLSGLFVPLMDPDAGVYASISKNMVLNGDPVNLIFQDTDWLDKPHFPFWVTAIFFRIFGFHDWAYKLPAILFIFIAARYTWLLARKYYDATTAGWSVVLLLSSLHIIISNSDVRAEPYLTGLIIASVYHFSNVIDRKWAGHLVVASLFAACAVMTKGLFTLLPIGGAVAGQLLLKKEWKQVFHFKWLIALALIAVFTLPEIWCLWKQFDQHPEKRVLGETGVSGIRFFLWDSQFGRFFNTGPIKGKGDKLFFLHTLLWAFLPWALLMYAALFRQVRDWLGKKKAAVQEWFTLSGSLLTLLLFSFSGFQLPHYTNIIFPFLSILTANQIGRVAASGKRIWPRIQYAVGALVLIFSTFLLLLFQPVITPVFIVGMAATLLFVVGILRKPERDHWTSFRFSALTLVAVGLFLNLCFYPSLLRYQSGNQAAAYLNRQDPGAALGRIGIYFPSGEFYLKAHTYRTDIDSVSYGSFDHARYLFVTESEKKQLEERNVSLEVIKRFESFHVTMLNLRFVSHHTRHKELKYDYLIRLQP
ncbi:MAG: hypothetical protein RJA57_760 [Bacteroidota bacterium]